MWRNWKSSALFGAAAMEKQYRDSKYLVSSQKQKVEQWLPGAGERGAGLSVKWAQSFGFTRWKDGGGDSTTL